MSANFSLALSFYFHIQIVALLVAELRNENHITLKNTTKKAANHVDIAVFLIELSVASP